MPNLGALRYLSIIDVCYDGNLCEAAERYHHLNIGTNTNISMAVFSAPSWTHIFSTIKRYSPRTAPLRVQSGQHGSALSSERLTYICGSMRPDIDSICGSSMAKLCSS